MSDKEITRRSVDDLMISPFFDKLVSIVDNRRVVSYGLSSYGYDARLAPEFKIFNNRCLDNGSEDLVIDPKKFSDNAFISHFGDNCIIPPNSFVLGRTIEHFRIPRDCIAICLGKSTYARCGVIVNVTPLEPEWNGHVTLEFSNTTQLPVRLYANEGACQFIFLKASSDSICDVSYEDRGGKYQSQVGIVLPKV